jgi:cytochrome c peroxidase
MLIALLAGSAGAAPHEHPPPVVLAPGYADLEFTPPKAGTYRLPPIGVAADGAVVASNGEATRLHDLLGGKITILSFIFTRCSDVNGCPLATYVLRNVQDRVAADPTLRDQVRLVSMSFDPAYDTPATLAAYAARFRKPGFDWRFVTSRNEAELAPVLEAYGQSVVPDVDESGNRLGSMSHILRVYLIDRERRIRNIYSVSFLHADVVANDVRTLLIEGG